MIDMDALLEQFPHGRRFAFTLMPQVGAERSVFAPMHEHADHLVAATADEVVELLDMLILWMEQRRVTQYPVIHAAALALSGSSIVLSQKHLRFLASIPDWNVLRRLEVNHEPTEEVAIRAHLTYLAMIYKGKVSTGAPWVSMVPLWTVRLMFEAWEQVQAGQIRTLQSPWLAELLLRPSLVGRESDKFPLPLEIRARLTPTNWVYEGHWCAERVDSNATSAPLLPSRQAQIAQCYPDLAGLPGGLIVELLSSQEVTDPDWNEPVPIHWQAEVEEMLNVEFILAS